MGLAAPLIAPSANLVEFSNYPRFSVRVPTGADTSQFCITIEPIAAGGIGLAQVSGIAPCMVYQQKGSSPPTFADVVAGQNGYLKGSSSGARVLWADALSSSSPNYVAAYGSNPASGTPWALVRLPETSFPLPIQLQCTSVKRQSTGGSMGFSKGNNAGLIFTANSPQLGVSPATANISLLTPSAYNKGTVQLLTAGLWSISLEWQIDNVSGPIFPYPSSGYAIYSWRPIATIWTSPDGVNWNWLESIWENYWQMWSTTALIGPLTCRVRDQVHQLLDCPSNTQISVVAGIDTPVTYPAGTVDNDMNFDSAYLRLCRLGPSQIGNT
jgi:hypothetical protein